MASCIIATEFGWTFEYIVNNMTVNQLKTVCETIQILKNTETANKATLVCTATATAFGSISNGKFKEYIEKLLNVKPAFDESKLKSLNIEVDCV